MARTWVKGVTLMFGGNRTLIPTSHSNTIGLRPSSTFGFVPQSTIYIAAGLNRTDDHQVLGELALHLARAFDGVVDFNGALIPSSTVSKDERTHVIRFVETSNWSDVAAPREQFFAKVAGKVVAVPYQAASGRTWATHIGDIQFMEAWLAHPDFHMIK